ncbi:hypothetical protein RB213_009428 [Colletotrichum asianum]
MTLKEGQAACGGGAESMGLLGRLDLSHALDERSRSALAPSPFYSPPHSQSLIPKTFDWKRVSIIPVAFLSDLHRKALLQATAQSCSHHGLEGHHIANAGMTHHYSILCHQTSFSNLEGAVLCVVGGLFAHAARRLLQVSGFSPRLLSIHTPPLFWLHHPEKEA